tara:strand:- start:1314 stop:2417 length:1104 start_codon:yes stop_codon:yes gene_type:complete
MKKSYLIAAGVAVIAVGWVASGQFGSKENAAAKPAKDVMAAKKKAALPRVKVKSSAAQSRVNELVILGKTEASRRVSLKAETAGRIVAIKAKKGDRIKKGDVIVKLALDDRPARLAEAKAKLRQRQIEFQAAKELSARNFRSKVKLAGTQALLESAKAEVAKAKLDLNRTVIRASFDGVLELRPVEIGDFVKIGNPVATIVDLSPMLVVANIPEAQISHVKSGLAAKARLINGRIITGKVRYVSAEAVTSTRTFIVEMETPNLDHSIVAGLTAELRLSLGEVKAHRVSPAVLTLSSDGLVGVKSVNNDGIVRFHEIKLVADTPEGMWLGGLPDQLTIISIGQEFVKVGQKVEPVPASSAAVSALKGK